MSVFSRFRNQFLGWWHDAPLPIFEAEATPIFQSWHRFASSSNTWIPLTQAELTTREDVGLPQGSRLVLVSWNVDASAPASKSRISAIISHLQRLDPPADVIFLQEVSRPALLTLLAIPWLREHWYSSEADTTNRGTVTLVSKSASNVALGPIWRVKYPSRFERDALCCDLLIHSQAQFSRIRLINIHLDSLAINPSLRPLQLSIVASYLRAAGQGLAAGDFNPVLPEDDTLVNANGLVDAWTEVRPDEAGFTWGIDGKQRFPPSRLDKVAMIGLKAFDIHVIPPGTCVRTSNLG